MDYLVPMREKTVRIFGMQVVKYGRRISNKWVGYATGMV